MPVPESGTPARDRLRHRASGIPYGTGLVKNSYVGRTFIAPTQLLRKRGIRLKLNPLREVVEGKRLVVVDDSIVRGNTQQALVAMMREAGAAEVHVRIASPPVMWPCHYGVDFATRAELIAAEPQRGGDPRVHRRGLAGLRLPRRPDRGDHRARSDKLCRACFDGGYPIELPAPSLLDKSLLEIKHTGEAVDLRAAEKLARIGELTERRRSPSAREPVMTPQRGWPFWSRARDPTCRRSSTPRATRRTARRSSRWRADRDGTAGLHGPPTPVCRRFVVARAPTTPTAPPGTPPWPRRSRRTGPTSSSVPAS